jgi:hypothetical protein
MIKPGLHASGWAVSWCDPADVIALLREWHLALAESDHGVVQQPIVGGRYQAGDRR